MFYWKPQYRPGTEEVCLLHVQQITSRISACFDTTAAGKHSFGYSRASLFIYVFFLRNRIFIQSAGDTEPRQSESGAAAVSSAAIY